MATAADAGGFPRDAESVPPEQVITSEIVRLELLSRCPNLGLETQEIRVFLALVKDPGFGEDKLFFLQGQQ